MNSERSRLRTFQNWPSYAPVDYERIAKAGFYYMGQNLEVQCFSCGGRISEWQYGDMVMAKHRLLDPRCPFVVNPTESGNVPITETPSEPEVAGGTSHIVNENLAESDLSDSSKYKSEAARFDTFGTWPIQSKIDGYRLAKAGFYYLQESDKVRCAFCRIDAYNWQAGDDPIVEHRRHSPTCPFLSNLSVGCSTRGSDDVITLRGEYCNFEPEHGLDADHMKDFGILNHRIPKHSKYMTEESRIASFDKWPKVDVKDPLELAKAGFYFTGVEDKVRCYHCGGGLKAWKPADNPWVEHAKWFPSCDFIFLIRGEEFVNDIRKKSGSFGIESQEGCSDSANASPASQTIDDNILQMFMTSAPVMSTLDLGLDVSRIKQVLREYLLNPQKRFPSKDELIAAVLDVQFNEPVADLTEESWAGDAVNEIHELRRQSSGASRSLLDRNFRSVNDDPLAFISEEDSSLIELRDYVDDAPNPPEEFAETDNNSEIEDELSAPLPEPEEMPVETTNEASPNKSATFMMPESVVEETNRSEITLEEENRRLKEAKLCKICMDQDVNIVFLPCGHLVTCSSCAANIPDCPVCRQLIKGTVRTFLA